MSGRARPKILRTLARRAYRRPATDADVDLLLGFFDEGRADGGFDQGVEMALRRLLVSPEFLLRVERDPAGADGPYPVSDLELASRLSFFLWSSLPDDELIEAASRGELRDPAVLEAQVRRMLADERSASLVTSFAAQWLYLRNLPAVSPDFIVFPDFDETLRRALRRETELFFESVVREDRSALDLITADYTFLNERLARHYGMPGVAGSRFRRVSLPPGSPRGGLLGHGSILAVTGYATRTSPVVRGKWVLENLLGTPPPPPPPANVPPLDEAKSAAVLSMRERMEEHRRNPACAACHALMDPVGLSLENFDAIGRWRTLTAGLAPIDATGGLPDGTTFDGVAGLRQALLDRSDQFVRTLVDKLMTYALGRATEHYDAPAGPRRRARRRGRRLPVLRPRPRHRAEHPVPDAAFRPGPEPNACQRSVRFGGSGSPPCQASRRLPRPRSCRTSPSLPPPRPPSPASAAAPPTAEAAVHPTETDPMIITKTHLPRRTFIRGMGATLALPLLDAMVPALTAAAKTSANPVRRLGFIYFPHGSVTWAPDGQNQWTPQGEGGALELSPILSGPRPGEAPDAGAHQHGAQERAGQRHRRQRRAHPARTRAG